MLNPPPRNSFPLDGWVIAKLNDLNIAASFDCGDPDLNEYFHKDIVAHIDNLMTQSYYLYVDSNPDQLVALIDFCNDSIRKEDLPSNAKRKIPNPKRGYKSFPAVKITRLGVNKNYHGRSIGTHLINMVKRFFLEDNRTGCRFITVDAYNKDKILKFYQKNEFKFIKEEDEEERNSATRAMFFDLKRQELGSESR